MTSSSIALPSEKPSLRAIVRALPFAFRFLFEVDRWRLVGSWSLTALELPLSSLGVLSIKGLTDELLAGNARGAFTWALVMLAVESVIMVRADLALRWNNSMRYFVSVTLRDRILSHQQRLPYAVLEDPAFQALVSAVRSRISSFWDMQISVRRVAQNFLRIAGLLTMAFVIPWEASLALLVSQVILFATYGRSTMLNWALFTMEQREGRRALYMQDVLGSPDNLLAARAIGLDRPFLTKWRAITDTIYRARLKELRQSANGQLLGDIAEWLGFVIGVLLTMRGVLDGKVEASAAIVFLTSYKQLAAALSTLSSTLQEMQDESTYLPALEQYFAIPVEGAGGKPVPPAPITLEIRDVWFRYPNAEQDTLRGVSLVLREGERIALAGVNGAGKTTLLKLLMGVYEPTAGSILVNGAPLSELDKAEWRATLAIMTQHDPEYSDTLETQVLYGDLAGERDGRRFSEALALSGLGDVAREFPRGLDTFAGKDYAMPEDHAVKLSGGQKQILAIARTTYRPARIYVFDEPTSAVDAEKEDAFFERLPGAMAGRTVVFVSHRFSTLRRAERIIVLEHGKVLEDGTHEDLMALKGRYAELFLLQAKQYAHDQSLTLNANG